jgi:hypothetical protein
VPERACMKKWLTLRVLALIAAAGAVFGLAVF